MECVICCDVYTASNGPVESVCEHTMCLSCSQVITQKGEGSCPMCRRQLRREDFRALELQLIADTCKEHVEAEALQACMDCMRLLCETCVGEHDSEHKLIPVSEAADEINRIITPITRAKVENAKLSHRRAREELLRQQQQARENILTFRQDMKAIVDSFIREAMSASAAKPQPLSQSQMLEQLYQSLSSNIRQFASNRAGENQHSVPHNSDGEEDISNSRNTTTATVNEDSKSNASITASSNIENDSDSINRVDVEYIDDMVYGLVDDDDFYEEEEDDDDDDDDINYDYDDSEEE